MAHRCSTEAESHSVHTTQSRDRVFEPARISNGGLPALLHIDTDMRRSESFIAILNDRV